MNSLQGIPPKVLSAQAPQRTSPLGSQGPRTQVPHTPHHKKSRHTSRLCELRVVHLRGITKDQRPLRGAEAAPPPYWCEDEDFSVCVISPPPTSRAPYLDRESTGTPPFGYLPEPPPLPAPLPLPPLPGARSRVLPGLGRPALEPRRCALEPRRAVAMVAERGFFSIVASSL